MSDRLSVSFEFFPPRDAPATEALAAQVAKLAAFNPAFVSVTYGAGGSTQDASMALADRLANGFHLPTAAHLHSSSGYHIAGPPLRPTSTQGSWGADSSSPYTALK